MADKQELYNRLPLEHLARLVNNEAGVQELSRTSGDLFKRNRLAPKTGGVVTSNPNTSLSKSPMQDLLKGM